jgi:hypothetical protein
MIFLLTAKYRQLPSTTIWKAVAEALSNGLSVLPESARRVFAWALPSA